MMLATDPTFAARAYEVHQDILRLRQAADALFLELGALLAQVRADELWRPLAYASFEEYLADPDVAISHTSAYRAMRVASAFSPFTASTDGTSCITPDAVVAVGIVKADLLVPVVEQASVAEAAEWVAKAATLTTSDLRREIRRRRGQDSEQRAWLDTLGYQLAALARQLGDTGEPLAVLDDISNRVIAARARLEQEAEQE
jgi:hypothetical protein